MLKRFIPSTQFWALASVILAILIYWRWFFTLNIYTWGDWGFLYSETVREWLTFPQVWYNAFLGGIDIGLSQYLPVRFFYGFLARFVDFVWFDRVVFLFPSVVLPAIGVFLLVKLVTKNNVAAFVGTLVYYLSTYILILNSGHLTLSTAFGLGVFTFLLFQAAIINKSLFYSVACGLVGFLASVYEVRAFYLVAFLLGFYFLYTLITTKTVKNFGKIANLSIYAAVPLILVGLLDSYWILGFSRTLQAFEGVVLNQPFFGLGHYNVQRIFALFHPFWTASHRISWGEIQPLPFYFWLIPFVAFSGFWLNRKNKEIVFWALIALIGIFLTKQTGEPFTNIYAWLYKYLPGFNAFRESSKFNFYVSLAYAVLIGGFVSWLWQKKIKFSLRILITVLIASLFLYNAKPVITGEFARLLTPRYIPQDYLVFKEFIQKQLDFFRTLYVPSDSRWGYWDSVHPKLSTRNLVQNDWRKLNDYGKTGLEYSEFEEVANIFQKPLADKLLDFSAIKYVVVPPEDKENEEVFIFPNNVSRNDYINFLSGLDYLKPADIGTKELVVFENEGNLPHFSLVPETEFEIITKSPTKYELILKSQPTEPVKLHFSESYHPGWKMRIGNFSWFESLFAKDYFLPVSNHQKSESGLNEFILSDSIKPGEKVTLYFAPQAYVNLGSVISLVTLVASFSLLLILWLTRKY